MVEGVEILAKEFQTCLKVIFMQFEYPNGVAATIDGFAHGNKDKLWIFPEAIVETLAVHRGLYVIPELFDVTGKAGHVGDLLYI